MIRGVELRGAGLEEDPPRKKLKVYIDYENLRYYITMSAAFALKLISYQQWMENEWGYYEISGQEVEEYEEKYTVEYERYHIVSENFIDHSDFANYADNNEKDIKELVDLRNELIQKAPFIQTEKYINVDKSESFFPKK